MARGGDQVFRHGTDIVILPQNFDSHNRSVEFHVGGRETNVDYECTSAVEKALAYDADGNLCVDLSRVPHNMQAAVSQARISSGGEQVRVRADIPDDRNPREHRFHAFGRGR